MIPREEVEDAQEEERDEAELNRLAEFALGLLLARIGSAAGASAEPGPEAAALGGLADNELDVRVVDGVDDLELLVLRELGHERSVGHWR